MNKFDRVTAILIHLQSKRLVTAQELSGRFEVSQRTIYRDIETLNNAGVPVIGEIGYRYFKLRDEKIIEHWGLIDATAIENQLKNASHGCKIAE